MNNIIIVTDSFETAVNTFYYDKITKTLEFTALIPDPKLVCLNRVRIHTCIRGEFLIIDVENI